MICEPAWSWRIAVAYTLVWLGAWPAGGADVPKAREAPEGHDIAWRLSGPGGGGWIESIAFDPVQKDTLYVGCDVGGFYVSTDAGRSYEIRNNGLRDYFIESIAVHPKDGNIILLGTESGLHRTADRGLHWQWLREGFPKLEQHRFSAPIGAVCFDSKRPNVAWAGTGRPRWGPGKPGAVDDAGILYRSDDAGLAWRRADGGQLPAHTIVSDIKVKPDEPTTVLLATTEGVFRSDDDGAHWKSSSEGLPHHYVEELAIAFSSPRTAYVTLRCTAKPGEAWNGGVYRSDDTGRTWRAAHGDGAEGLPRRILNKPGDALHLSSNPKEIVVDPRDANVVCVGHRDWVTAGVYKTIDGGQHWSPLIRRTKAQSNMDYGWITMWGPAVECLAISPAAPDRLAFGTSGQVYLTDDGGKSWQQRYSKPAAADGHLAGSGLEVTCVWRIVADPVRRGRVYYGYMDIGLLISDDDGRTFGRSNEGMKMGGNCFGIVVDPRSPKTLWAATGWWDHNDGDVCRSDDDGLSWRVVGHPESGLPAGQVLEMALDERSPVGNRRLLAISNGNGVFEARDGGASWHAINGNLPADATKSPAGLLLDPLDPNHVVFASRSDVYETRDGGKAWQKLNGGNDLFRVTRLVADPKRFNTLYLSARQSYDQATRRMAKGGLFRSDDGGRTWRQLLDDRYAADVAVSAADPNVLYAATKEDPYFDNPMGSGLLKSTDGGRTWHREVSGMSNVNVKTVCVSPVDPGTIYAGTAGNSAFVGRDAKVSR